MSKQPSVFLVEDDPDDRFLFCEALKIVDAGITCTIAQDGEDAIGQMQAMSFNAPYLIFADVNMPRMNGLEFLMALKQIATLKSVPVLMYSTSSVQSEMNKMLEAGASEFLIKASSFKALCLQIEEALIRYKPDGVG